MLKKAKRTRSTPATSLPVADAMQFETLARKRLSQMAYDYIRSGGAGEITMRENRLAFERLSLSPRVLVDVSEINTRISLLGAEVESPILLAPIAYQRLFHPDGELATARAANSTGTIFVISSFTTTAIDEIAEQTQQPIWFQLYAQRDRGLRATWWRAPCPRAARLFASPWTRRCSAAATARLSSRLRRESTVLNCTDLRKRSNWQAVKRVAPASTIFFPTQHSTGAILSGCAHSQEFPFS